MLSSDPTQTLAKKMLFFILKSLHIIFVITWFAGLFYIVRLFIYTTEAEKKTSPEKEILQKQFKLMQRRLWYGITWPSAILTLVFGLALLHSHNSWPTWLILKLSLVALLYLYHYSCQVIFKQQKNDIFKYSSLQLRIWNEVATLFLFAIIFTVVLKSYITWKVILIGTIGLALILYLSIMIFRAKARKAVASNQENVGNKR